jgi:hypothetical protein
MFKRFSPATVPPSNNIAQPHDTCLKCGRATPVGVSLCELDNPGHIKSPSSSQVHGTIVVGFLFGIVLLLALYRFASAGIGPFSSSLVGVATRADGGLDVVVRVGNQGAKVSGTSCRISASGTPDFRDFVFFSEPIPPGQSADFTETVPPAPGAVRLSPQNLVVRCS